MRTRVGRAALTAVALCISVLALAPAGAAATTTRYSLANGCYALRAVSGGQYVVKSGSSYFANAATLAAATPFRMQATALGRYLLYGPDATHAVHRAPQPGRLHPHARRPRRLDRGAGSRRLHARRRSPPARAWPRALAGKLGLVAAASAHGFTFVAAQGCAKFPEIEVNVTGHAVQGLEPDRARCAASSTTTSTSAPSSSSAGASTAAGPWSPYGVTVGPRRTASDHQPNGAGAVVENFFSTGTPVGTHSTEGWPSFAGWPRDESQTHEGTYWKWIERAWRSGLRIMVNDLVENRALCELYPLKKNNCNEMVSAYKQAEDMHALQDYIDAQFGGPGKGFFRLVKSSAEARKVINEGKLAVVLGDRGVRGARLRAAQRDARTATPAKIDAELDKLYGIGVRSLFPVHKFDNALGGTKLRQRRHRRARQHRQQVRDRPVLGGRPLRRPGPRQHAHHRSGTSRRSSCTRCSAPCSPSRSSRASCPVYPPGPHCNPKGLTALGEYVIRSMMTKGMIVETDHMSVKARRQVLDDPRGARSTPA